MNQTDNEKVAQTFACPTCGNRDMDSLAILGPFDLAECGACGTIYNPQTSKIYPNLNALLANKETR